MKNKKDIKQEKFQELYLKFAKKCLQESMVPVMTIRYQPNGIIPMLDFREVDKKEQENIVNSLKNSSLNK